MPYLDRLTNEAFGKLCDGCPALDDASRMFENSEPFSYIDGEGKTQTIDADVPLIRLGHQVVTAAYISAVLMLKEEIGCQGSYDCGACDDLHCGALRLISPRFRFGADVNRVDEYPG